MAELRPLHSITDAKLLSIRLALGHLSSRTEWTWASSYLIPKQPLACSARPTRVDYVQQSLWCID